MTVPVIESVHAVAYTIPTDAPESDGTLEWAETTIVIARISAGGVEGLGYTYADATAAALIDSRLAEVIRGLPAFEIPRAFVRMNQSVRNVGHAGIAATAISAVDVALWDLKCKLLGLSLVDLLGSVRDGIEIYGSGGFTSYSIERLQKQLAGWAAAGARAVKMKVGRDASRDPSRVAAARDAIGADVALMVDANGAWPSKKALAMADAFAAQNVVWFEEPVSSDDLEGLRLMRDRAPAGMEIAAGEYGFDSRYFRRMLEPGAVDVLQADATRCGGITGFLQAAAICEAFGMPLSSHTAPALHVHLGCAVASMRYLEYFHDHVRIESMLFEGARVPEKGLLGPDHSRPGLGIEFRDEEAKRFSVP